MKYLPNLVPEEHKPKIDLDLYLTEEKRISQKKTNLAPLYYIIASLMGILFLFNVFTRFFAAIFFLFIGLVMLPDVHKGIEHKLSFNFNWKIKSGFILVLMIPTILFSASYMAQERNHARIERIAEVIIIKKEKAEQAEKVRLEKLRIDSLNYYTNKADSLKNKKKT